MDKRKYYSCSFWEQKLGKPENSLLSAWIRVHVNFFPFSPPQGKHWDRGGNKKAPA
jgi:hypothetical protein